MGETWIAIWIFSFIGLLIIGIAIYDYVDRKNRGRMIKLWKYLLAILIGLGFMFPIVSGIVLSLLYPFIHR